jgi:sodium-dependent dicarboxylate transporter 2/3/5
MAESESDKTSADDQKITQSILSTQRKGVPTRLVVFLLCLGAALTATLILRSSTDLEPAAGRALFILLFAALLWITEAVPGFAVGILIIALNVALLGEPGGVYAKGEDDWIRFVEVLGNPLIWLFFGGFVLADGMTRTGLDKRLAGALLKRLGDEPMRVLVGIMIFTFVLSMFVSNTATVAMMLAVMAPLVASIHKSNPYGRGLLVGLAVSANLGGMGSLIGTAPNAIAVGVLSGLPNRVEITFLDWMLIGLPPAAALLVLAIFLIRRRYPSQAKKLDLSGLLLGTDRKSILSEEKVVPSWQRFVVSLTMTVTLGLWLTSQWHGIPTAAVSFIPIVLLTSTGIIGGKEIRGLNWDVLFLIAGGLALGQVVTGTGLSEWIVHRLPVEGLPVALIALVLSYTAVVMSNFMSNTAAANILIPIGAALVFGAEARIVVPIALCASAAMSLPVATPPNAMVFATERCETRDFIRIGTPLGLVAPILIVLWTTLTLDWILSLY